MRHRVVNSSTVFMLESESMVAPIRPDRQKGWLSRKRSHKNRHMVEGAGVGVKVCQGDGEVIPRVDALKSPKAWAILWPFPGLGLAGRNLLLARFVQKLDRQRLGLAVS